MADFGDFNFDFGTDPFGGGSEFGVVPGSTGVFGGGPAVTPEPSTFDNIAGSLFGGGGDKGGKPSGGVVGAAGDFAKSALPFAQLGTAGLGIGLGIKGSQQQAEQTKIARGAEKRQEQIAGKAQELAAPLSQFSQQQLQQAISGKIDPAAEQEIQLWLQGAKQKVMDFFSRSGQGDSLQLQNELLWLDQMADGMRMQAVQGEESTAIAAAGTAGGVLGTGASAAAGAGGQAQQQGGNIQALIAEANRALGTLAGSSA